MKKISNLNPQKTYDYASFDDEMLFINTLHGISKSYQRFFCNFFI